MFWSASRLMSKPVRLLARRTDSYVHAHAVLRSPMRLFGAVAGASADSYDAGDDNDGIGNGAGVGSDAGAAADSGHAGTVAFAGTSAGTFAGTPSFYEAIDIADVVRARRLRRIRFILVRCVSVLLIVGAVVVASLPFAMQAHSARRLAETSDSAARTVAGWPYPMAMEELERARAYNRRLAVEGQPVLGEAADPFTTRPAGTAGDADTADDSAPSGGAGLSAADTDAIYQGLLDSGAGIMGTVLVPKIGVEQRKWIALMSVLSILALPLTLLEYYFTKERVTLEAQNSEEPPVPFAKQLKAIFTDKYMLIIYAYFLIFTFGASIKNLSLVYFCNYVLGTYNDGITQTMLSVIGGIPMGIGVFAVWPLAKKFGKRNVTLAGFVLYALGSAVCWMFPTNMTIMLAGQFVKNIGGLPCSYVFMALFADVLDHVEWKSGFRCDGLAMSVYNIIAVAMVGICTGVFNGLLAKTGYTAPEIINGVTTAAEQSAAVKHAITFGFVGLETITGVVLAVLLAFLNVEKYIGKEQAEIKARREAE